MNIDDLKGGLKDSSKSIIVNNMNKLFNNNITKEKLEDYNNVIERIHNFNKSNNTKKTYLINLIYLCKSYNIDPIHYKKELSVFIKTLPKKNLIKEFTKKELEDLYLSKIEEILNYDVSNIKQKEYTNIIRLILIAFFLYLPYQKNFVYRNLKQKLKYNEDDESTIDQDKHIYLVNPITKRLFKYDLKKIESLNNLINKYWTIRGPPTKEEDYFFVKLNKEPLNVNNGISLILNYYKLKPNILRRIEK